MKKAFFLSFLCLAFFCDVEAQKWGIGAYWLPENTHITANAEKAVYKNKITFAGGGGINVDRKIGRSSWVFQTGLLYTSHNQKFKFIWGPGANSFYKGKKRLDYLSLPILLKHSTRVNKRTKMFIFFGPEVSYLLKGAGAVTVYQKYPDHYYLDLPPSGNSYYKQWIVQAVAGIGYDYQLARYWTLNTALRVECSLMDITNHSSQYEGKPFYHFDENLKNFKSHAYAIGLILGVTYSFGRDHLLCPSQKW